jgi:hypothetical protein
MQLPELENNSKALEMYNHYKEKGLI